MIEKVLFGDTNHLYALVLASIGIVLLEICRGLLGGRHTWFVLGAFLVVPVGNLSFQQYVGNARTGYGEAVGAGLFLLGLLLMLRTEPRWGGPERATSVKAAAAGACLAAAMFIRPNFAFAAVWLGGSYAWACVRRRAYGRLAAVAGGLALALWMPFHNWYYGGELYAISKSGATLSVPLGPSDYAAAVRDALSGVTGSRRKSLQPPSCAAGWGNGAS
jgi:hypothetical protein